MIDFKNGTGFKLSKTNNAPKDIDDLLIEGENVIGAYKGARDYVVFTTKRIIACNVQGLTGQKKDYTSLPYSKVQAFSVETAGQFDWDGELDLFFSGLGKIRFEFSGQTNMKEIGKHLGEYVLK